MKAINWKEEYMSLIRSIGSITYGKERWFFQENEKGLEDMWYDRHFGDYVDIDKLHKRVYETIKEIEDYY